MPTLVWGAPMRFSSRDETAFFDWLQSIPGVISVRGEGRTLLIRLRSSRLSKATLLEFIAVYERYQGNLRELADFENLSNTAWLRNRNAYWHEKMFLGGDQSF
jgi:hypothetical protein